ncbi:MAG: hypothetical protein ACM3XM_21475 [Mycobacterium leprae]
MPAVTLSYCWHEWYQAVCSDSIPLTEILQRHGIAATLVPAGELIRISWPNQPRAIKVVDHRTDNLLVESDGKIMAPTTPGVYAYELWTEWGQGTAWYGFLIQVP